MKNRLCAAYFALLGRPVIYRAHIKGSLIVKEPHTFVAEGYSEAA